MDESFGALLAGLRRAAGMTQEALAERAGLSPAAVGALERGVRRYPRRHTLSQLARALGLTADQQRDLFAAVPRRSQAAPRLNQAAPRLNQAEPQQEQAAPQQRTLKPRQLPPVVPDFTGRTSEIQSMTALLGPERDPAVPAIVVVTGMAGVGKSALSLRVAQALAGQYPDGQLYADLRGSSAKESAAPVDVLGRLLLVLGMSPEEVPLDLDSAAARFRTLTAGSRLLLVLDDAADVRQVTSLLPAGGGCGVIVTSRQFLGSLPVSGRVQLGPLDDESSLRLLGSMAGVERLEAEPGAARSLVELCGRLPLAVRLAGARLAGRPGWPVSELVSRLTSVHLRLAELDLADAGLRAAFDDSLAQLATRDQDAFGLLGVFDGPDLSVAVAARLLDLPELEAGQLLDRLADLHLLEPTVAGRYRFHDLLRSHAVERAGRTIPVDRQSAAVERVVRLFGAVAWRSCQLSRPGSVRLAWAAGRWTEDAPDLARVVEALDWLEAEAPNVVAAALQARGEAVVRLSIGLTPFYLSRGYWGDYFRICRAALLNAIRDPADDRLAEAFVRNDLGLLQSDYAVAGIGDHAGAVRQLEQALEIFEQAGESAGAGMCLTNLAHVCEQVGNLPDAVVWAERSVALAEKLADGNGEVWARLGLAELLAKAADEGRALGEFRSVLELAEGRGDESAVATALLGSGRILRRHDPDGLLVAVEGLRHSAELFAGSGDRGGTAAALEELGLATKDPAPLEEALALMAPYEDRAREEAVRGRLAELRAAGATGLADAEAG